MVSVYLYVGEHGSAAALKLHLLVQFCFSIVKGDIYLHLVVDVINYFFFLCFSLRNRVKYTSCEQRFNLSLSGWIFI